jgi:hypothetical protein
MKRPFVLLGSLLLVLAIAAPALAAQPVQEFKDQPFDFDLVVDPAWGWFDCGFPVIYGSYGTESLRVWYDADQFPIKGIYQRDGTDWFQKVGSDKVVAGDFRLTSHASGFKAGPPVTWTEKLTGHFWGIHLPGQGVVYHESGQYWQDVTESIPENLYSDPYHVHGNFGFDPDVLCAALAD